MNKKITVVAALVIALLALAAGQLVASPAQGLLNWGGEVNAGQCETGNLVINITHAVVNDIDSGLGGFWAYDSYTKHVQVWQTGEDSFCVVARYLGSFVTDDGPSPGNTDTIAAGIRGTFQGGYQYTFDGTLNSSPAYPSIGYLGNFDYGCDVDTDLGDYSSCTGLFSWVGTYFTSDSNWSDDFWGWIYRTPRNGTWVNALAGNVGDITD